MMTTLMKQSRGFLLAGATLAAVLGFGLAVAPEKVLDLLPFFEPEPNPSPVAFLRLVGLLLFGTSLMLGLLVPAELSPLGQRLLVAVFAPLAIVCLLMPLLAQREEPLVMSRLLTKWSVGFIVLSSSVILLKHGTLSRRTARERALEEIGEAAARQERSRLARDLHDSIKQQLFSIKMSSATAEERWDRDSQGARAALADVRSSAQAAMVEMQAMLAQLRPEPLAAAGLVEALREQCEALGYRTGARVDFEVGDLPPAGRLPSGAEENLFRIAQEALSNVARHARAGAVRVRLESVESEEDPLLLLLIEDDGQGFDPRSPSSGMGLRNMRERVEALGGDLRIDSTPGEGTRLAAGVPLTSPAPESRDDYPFLIKLAVVPALIGLFIDSPEPFWAAACLYFTGQGSLKVFRAESRGLGAELGRLFHQQLFFLSALAFWWSCTEAVPKPPTGKLPGIVMWDHYLEYLLAWLPWIVAPLAGTLACWEAWRFLRLRRFRPEPEPLHNPWLFAAVLILFVASLPILWLSDPAMTGVVAARLASALYLAWFLRLIAIEVRS